MIFQLIQKVIERPFKKTMNNNMKMFKMNNQQNKKQFHLLLIIGKMMKKQIVMKKKRKFNNNKNKFIKKSFGLKKHQFKKEWKDKTQVLDFFQELLNNLKK